MMPQKVFAKNVKDDFQMNKPEQILRLIELNMQAIHLCNARLENLIEQLVLSRMKERLEANSIASLNPTASKQLDAIQVLLEA